MLCTATSGDVTGGAGITIISILSAAARRAKLKQITIGCSGTPADGVAKFVIRRITADGTGTGAYVKACDLADGTPSCTSKVEYTVEPTYEANGALDEIALNQRPTLVKTYPYADSSIASEIGSGNGLGVTMVSGPALAYNVSLIFEE